MPEWSWVFEKYQEPLLYTTTLVIHIKRPTLPSYYVKHRISDEQIKLHGDSVIMYAVDKMLFKLRAKLPAKLIDEIRAGIMEQFKPVPVPNTDILAYQQYIKDKFSKYYNDDLYKPSVDTYREKAASEFEGVEELDSSLWNTWTDLA